METILFRVRIVDSRKHKAVLTSLPLPINRAVAFATMCKNSLPIEFVLVYEEVRYDD